MDDLIQRQAVLKTLDDMDNVLDEDRTIENYKELLKECYEVLPPVQPQEPTDENLHREREQAYMQGYEDASKRFRQEPCEDAISRQAVLDIVDSYSESRSNVEDVTQDMISDILALPPVTPKPKTGHWKWMPSDDNPKIGNWHCSECRCVVVECVDKNEKGGIPLYKYCPQCGAKMIEPQESED